MSNQHKYSRFALRSRYLMPGYRAGTLTLSVTP